LIEHWLVKHFPWQEDCDQHYLAEYLIPLVYLALDLPKQRNVYFAEILSKTNCFLAFAFFQYIIL